MHVVTPDEASLAHYLRLANGQEWRIIALDETRVLLEKIASAMGLAAYEGQKCPTLIIRPFEPKRQGKSEVSCEPDAVIQSSFPRSGWNLTHPSLVQFLSHPDVPDVICEVKLRAEWFRKGMFATGNLTGLRSLVLPVLRRAWEAGALSLHAALVEWNETGILLSGPDGIGKTTCCSRLPSPWRALCDDETLIVLDSTERYVAHPFPTWSNLSRTSCIQTWGIRLHVPLSAMFFLEQADSDEAIPVGQGQAAYLVNRASQQTCCQQSYRSLNFGAEIAYNNRAFENACRLAKEIPAYILRVSLTGRFWEKAEEVLSRLRESAGTKETLGSQSNVCKT